MLSASSALGTILPSSSVISAVVIVSAYFNDSQRQATTDPELHHTGKHAKPTGQVPSCDVPLLENWHSPEDLYVLFPDNLLPVLQG